MFARLLYNYQFTELYNITYIPILIFSNS